MNADGDATEAAVAHDGGLDALLGARQRSVRLSRSVTADGKLSEHALTARKAQAAPRFLRWLRRNPELALCLWTHDRPLTAKLLYPLETENINIYIYYTHLSV